ncbi:hypothetical protein BH10ACI3_BH10ACI3_14050 [soil metagenome]
MSFFDLLIIYLACGSPLGVHQLMKRNDGDRSSRWMFIAATFLLWPIFAISFLIKFYNDKGLRKDIFARKAAEEIMFEIEQIAFAEGSASALFEFRDVFYRYSGLLESSRAKSSAAPSTELFEVSGNNAAETAAMCLVRRNQARLEFHLAHTRTEFVDLVSHIADSTLKSEQVFELANELADELADSQARSEISRSMHTESKTTRRPPNVNRSHRAVHISVAG